MAIRGLTTLAAVDTLSRAVPTGSVASHCSHEAPLRRSKRTTRRLETAVSSPLDDRLTAPVGGSGERR